MERYVFSGSMGDRAHDLLAAKSDFEPIDFLVTQLDRSGVTKAIKWKREGFIKWIMIDSGAFSVWTGKASTTIDEYIEYVNSIQEDIDYFAELDSIPGTPGKPNNPEDYVKSAEDSWNTYLYMREHVVCPDKIIPIFHYGEPFEALDRILNWKDENGNYIDYIGIGGTARGVSQKLKHEYFTKIFAHIKSSPNPDVKVHLYGATSLDIIFKYPCYSADSVSHLMTAAYCEVYSYRLKSNICVSNRKSTSKHFELVCGEEDLATLKSELEDFGITYEEAQEDSTARTAFTMYNIQKVVKDHEGIPIKPIRTAKKLF